MNTFNYKTFLLPCIIIILLILLYVNKDSLFPFYEALSLKKPVPAPARPDERAAYNDNKEQTSAITSLTYNTKLNDVSVQINDCQNLIDEINSILPRNVKDIQIGNVTQTDNLENVKIDIESKTITSLDPVTNTNAPAAVWTLNAILPRGKQGKQGIQGRKGVTGPEGSPGEVGEQGLQGEWGSSKNCDKC